MNRRQIKKNKKKILLALLEITVSSLDENSGKYKARAIHIPSVELKTLTKINGFRVEIRTTRENRHNCAHFHIVKGKEGASVRIDDFEVLENSLKTNDFNRVMEWAKANRDLLVEMWNEFHGYRIIVE